MPIKLFRIGNVPLLNQKRYIQTKEYKAIFVLWLGYPRKQGDKNDCYKAFTKMVERGNFPNSLDALILDSQED
ncbi:type II toxin-antitoxin system YhaV family toxin [Microcystis sp. M169S2]|uniref:type II toxin-antitoxin system YhaV family toxin n=1 Tax=Microcystis sp. M169S2 TaxID=2771157 RepID=UPI00258A646C|nr:type II toxin-antitoxin system YhaV family toxin [Microcystis sp. M169S2]